MGDPGAVEVATPRGVALAHVRAPADGSPRAVLALGHGAGGSVGAPDLVAIARAATDRGLTVVLVEQPYRVAGRRSPPPAAHLDTAWSAVIDHLRPQIVGDVPLIAGGRSAGARVACRTAPALGAAGVLCVAFPLRPPRRGSAADRPTRLPELEAVAVPVLVIQGAADPFGIPPAGPRRTVVEVPGTHTLRTGLAQIGAAAGDWLDGLLSG